MFALYARQSVDRADSISVESQLEFCAFETKGQPYKTYIDKGFSGKDIRRPAFVEMLAAIRAGEVHTVVVYKLDRVSRSVLDFGKMMEEFERRGVSFISATERFDTQQPMGRAMLSIAMVFAQLERETIQKRVADSYLARSKHGFYMGGRLPYGFRLEPAVVGGVHTARYSPLEAEAEQVRLIYTLYAAHEASLGDVVRYFQEHGVIHLRGGAWSTARLSELLRNPVYVSADLDIYEFFRAQGAELVNDAADFQGINGCYLFKGGARTRKQSALDQTTLVLAPHEGLVSSEIWLKCREKCMGNRRAAFSAKVKNSWLAGMVKCGRCGGALTVKKSDTQMGRYFVCSAKYATKRCTGAGTLYAPVIEGYLAEQIKEKLAEFGVLTRFQRPAESAQVSLCRLEITRLDTSIERLLDQMIDTADAAADYIGGRINRLDAQKKEWQEKLAALTRSVSGQDAERMTDVLSRWENASFDDRRRVSQALIEVIKIADERLEIVWRL